MKITKKQIRRIIREAISGKAMGGPNRGQSYSDIVMQSLAAGDTSTATEAILDSYMMDDTWRMEEDALEDMLIDLGPNPTPDDIGAVSDEWLTNYRAGKYRPKTKEEQQADWDRGGKPRTDYSRK